MTTVAFPSRILASPLTDGRHALGVVRDAVAAGGLPGAHDVRLVEAMTLRGGATADLVVSTGSGGPDRMLECRPDEQDVELIRRARSDLAITPSALHRGSRQWTGVAASTAGKLHAAGLAAAMHAIRTSGRLESTFPALVFWIQALGRDARPRLHRILAGNPYDLRSELDRLVDRHTAAAAFAERQAARGSTAAISGVALAVATDLGLPLAAIVDELTRRREALFQSECGRFDGAFTWHGFALTVDVESHAPTASGTPHWRLRGDELTVRDTDLSDTIKAATGGRTLGTLASVPLPHLDAVIERTFRNADGDLVVALRPETIPLDGGLLPIAP